MEFLKTVVEKLGIDNEMLSKIEAGQLQVDDVVTSYVSQVEKSVSDRIAKQIEEQKKTELFGAAYAKTEKQLADEFGVDLSKYESIDKRDRYKSIIKDLKQSQIEMVENIKKEYSSADAQKLQQLTQQLELANAKLNESERNSDQRVLAEQQKFQDYIKNQQIDGIRNKLVEGIKNPRLNPKEMRAVFEAEVREKGFTFEMDADGNIWVNKDGNRVKHPQKATENLKYETLFEMVSNENNFTRQSNASEPQKFVFNDEKTKDGLHPARLKYLQERNLI
jgi:transcriptional regulator with XRE-family HTH domain